MNKIWIYEVLIQVWIKPTLSSLVQMMFMILHKNLKGFFSDEGHEPFLYE